MPRSKKKLEIHDFAPIPEELKKEWTALVNRGKEIVARSDTVQYELIFLFGTVESSYGDQTIARFADEIGINKQTGYTYRKLWKMGVDEKFIEKWGGLGYSMIREILFFTGKVANPATQFFLNYAEEHKMSVRAMQAYLLDTTARDRAGDIVEKEMKLALQSKQEMEGFSDVIRYELERITEEHPELEDEILQAKIMTADDVNRLKIGAGILTDDEETLVTEGKRYVDKIKRSSRWFMDNKTDLVRSIEYGHEFSDDIRFSIEKMIKMLSEVAETKTRPPLSLADKDVTVLDIPDSLKETGEGSRSVDGKKQNPVNKTAAKASKATAKKSATATKKSA